MHACDWQRYFVNYCFGWYFLLKCFMKYSNTRQWKIRIFLCDSKLSRITMDEKIPIICKLTVPTTCLPKTSSRKRFDTGGASISVVREWPPEERLTRTLAVARCNFLNSATKVNAFKRCRLLKFVDTLNRVRFLAIYIVDIVIYTVWFL